MCDFVIRQHFAAAYVHRLSHRLTFMAELLHSQQQDSRMVYEMVNCYSVMKRLSLLWTETMPDSMERFIIIFHPV